MFRVLRERMKLTQSKNGVLVPIRVKPRARANKIDGVRDGVLLLSVSAPPVDSAANEAVIAVLAQALDVAKSTLFLAHGQKSRDKTVAIAQLPEEEVAARLTAAFSSE